ncbi:NagD protein [Lebetimonas natsushimae]|uniref:NagD protein n=1 Tax=Lebetimonas natsushimae TaxID=1936991 RepID=A0A292YDQ6_9BACT|nr:HAD hydrolase-like protein [Lebetimonas natsushimae]GAX87501.1 NagD protein [Lebetimonas natsushimae]
MKAFFIDVQGTLIDDKKFFPLPGAIEFINYLNKNDYPFVLITNNTKKEDFKNYLAGLGFNFKYYLDPLMVADRYIKGSIAPFGNEKFVEIMSKKYKVDFKNPDNVVLGIKIFPPDEIADIIEYLLNGANLIGMHKTSLYHKNNKRYPGLGAILEMLHYATNREYKVVGKPSFEFFEAARKKINLNYDKITIISDDLIGDLIPAAKLGMKTALVLSGKIKSIREVNKNVDFVAENIGEYLKRKEFWI